MSDGRIAIEADPKTASQIWQTYGLAQAYEALGGKKPKSQLPGFALALALVDKELAEMRAQMSGAIYRCAARAGHDVAKIAAIYTSIKDSKPHLEIEMADLVDQAEAE